MYTFIHITILFNFQQTQISYQLNIVCVGHDFRLTNDLIIVIYLPTAGNTDLNAPSLSLVRLPLAIALTEIILDKFALNMNKKCGFHFNPRLMCGRNNLFSGFGHSVPAVYFVWKIVIFVRILA